ncbi:uncharacterized protein SCODWIG_01417 [Saccharomycodes ludwigii]|uniref:Clathrin/coatomer adaptor adaptin-like N-terminal domain-containing protein n=1 Tax=Saccharomycodes ludwigii TaxID=36035 RepID=A0A376B4N7_9ASCO|nr:uncharacterized protein SCODWIG_01417 [Saccharomycodes ludwigii]
MTDSISRITSALESARDLTLEAAAAASSRLGSKGMYKPIKPSDLRDLLNSKNERDVKKALKALMFSISTQREDQVGSLFPDVLKNINCHDLKTRRMVYIYLLRFSEIDSNTALLSINSIQQSLTDKNPEGRALALEVLSSMKIPSIYPLVLYSVKEMIKDTSYKVRSVVVTSFARLYEKKFLSSADLVGPLKDLLSDSDYRVVGPAFNLLSDFIEEDAKYIELLHGYFRRYCRDLCNFDSFFIPRVIEVLLGYCKQFLKPECDDLQLFLNSLTGNILYSFNEYVLLAAAKAFYQLSSNEAFAQSPLSSALVKSFSMANKQIKSIVAENILFYEVKCPECFSKHLTKFFLLPTVDSQKIMALKIQIMAHLVDANNIDFIVDEFQDYALCTALPSSIRSLSIRCLTVCEDISDKHRNRIMGWLLRIFKSHNYTGDTEITNSLITLLRCIISKNPASHTKTLWMLAKVLIDSSTMSQVLDDSKAGIIWILGEFLFVKYEIGAEVLRHLLPIFAGQSVTVKLQILNFSSKLLCYDIDRQKLLSPDIDYDFEQSVFSKMFEALVDLAKFDDDYDIRDRTRTYYSLFHKFDYQIATLLLQAPKQQPKILEDISLISLETKSFQKSECWAYEDINENNNGSFLRDKEEPIKDYSRSRRGISSNDYFVSKSKEFERNPERGANTNTNTRIKNQNGNYNSSRSKVSYKLKSLDEFFADIPTTKPKSKRRIIIQEESSSSEEKEDEEDEDDNNKDIDYDDDDDDDEEEEEEEEEEESESDNENEDYNNEHNSGEVTDTDNAVRNANKDGNIAQTYSEINN